jgi:hypothetical protein
MDKTPQAGNIGIVTTKDDKLCEVTSNQNGLIYSLPMEPPKALRVCLPDQFWVLLDKMPD